MLAPERRTRVDLIVAALIAVVLLVAGTIVWFTGDAHGTTSLPAEQPLPEVEPASAVPNSLSELWRAPSSSTAASVTSAPIVTGSAVVTADGGDVLGREPRTGVREWSYSRDLPLCGAVGSWDSAVAVYRDDRGCSQVTELDGSSGERRDQRSSDADSELYLSTDGTYVTARGDTRMELWRSDLVRTLEYGRVDAAVVAGAQPRAGCSLLSSASSSLLLAVLERCPDDPAPRLTLLDPAPDDANEPEESGSTVVPQLADADDEGRIVAVGASSVAVAIPAPSGGATRLVLFDSTASQVADVAIDAAESSLPNISAVDASSTFVWFTGDGVAALAATDLRPVWSLPGALGGGAVMAGRLLVPVPDAIEVLDPATGAMTARVAVDRGDYDGPVTTSVIGDVIVEQRGSELVALG